MRRWMPVGLMFAGLIALAVLALPLITPSLLWAFAFNPVLTTIWDGAAVMAAVMFVTGGLWSIARMRRSHPAGGYSRRNASLIGGEVKR